MVCILNDCLELYSSEILQPENLQAYHVLELEYLKNM